MFKYIFFNSFSIGNYGEIIIKTPDEYWIAGKSSNDREFYVVIQDKNANLKDIAGMFCIFYILPTIYNKNLKFLNYDKKNKFLYFYMMFEI